MLCMSYKWTSCIGAQQEEAAIVKIFKEPRTWATPQKATCYWEPIFALDIG